jgi:enamine deaminase RidA (YjgF/YER057c/UK114 family)
VLHSDDYFAPVAFLVIEECHLEDKDTVANEDALLSPYAPAYAPFVPPFTQPCAAASSPTKALALTTPSNHALPAMGSFRNQFFLGGVMSAHSLTLTLEDEIADVFSQATATLARHGLTLEDACFVHLYVRDMDDFARINTEYCKFFGQHMPPSRSCVELRALPARVLLDCLLIKGSGVAKRETPRSAMRDVLHIKSLSAWAPNCIGPYSQANILHKSLILLAGQVAFEPATMRIIGSSHLEQTHQCLRNAANVLDALASNLRHVSCGVVYVVSSPQVETLEISDAVAAEARRLLISNAGVRDAFENAYNSSESDDDVDKSQALVALASHAPLLVVQLSHLPRDALVEAELQALTHAPVKSLRPVSKTLDRVDVDGWAIHAQYSAIPRSLCHVVCTATQAVAESMATACRGLLLAVQRAFEAAEMPWDRLAHLRVFYVPHKETHSEAEIARGTAWLLRGRIL